MDELYIDMTKYKDERQSNDKVYPIDRNRTAHMVGVAEYMYYNAGKYNLDPDEMYVVGLLHDIGYISGDKHGHEQYGADLIQKCFSTNFGMPYIGEVIAHHGDRPTDYLSEHDLVPDELKLLWEADMSVDLTGENVGFEKRLADIGERHGFGSHPYETCKQTMDWLKENCE